MYGGNAPWPQLCPAYNMHIKAQLTIVIELSENCHLPACIDEYKSLLGINYGTSKYKY